MQLSSASHVGFMRMTRKCHYSHLSHKDSAKFIHILKVTLGATSGAGTQPQPGLSALLSQIPGPEKGSEQIAAHPKASLTRR